MYLYRTLSGATKLRPAKWNSTCEVPGGSAISLPGGMTFLSAMNSSSTTGGSLVLLVRWRGSTIATPFMVGNHNLPSRVFHPAGWLLLVHSALFKIGRASCRERG